MHDKRAKAIANNNGLYEAVFANRGIGFDKTAALWYSVEKAPPLYSNITTRSLDWRPDDVFDIIERRSAVENWEDWSIKDSFGVLDLGGRGFTRLFDARWVYLEADAFAPVWEDAAVTHEVITHEIVTDADGLAAWRLVWDPDAALGRKIFGPGLLDSPDVFFVAGQERGRLTSGCLVNRTGSVLGISNVFAPEPNVVSWSCLVRFIFQSIGRADIVGYERPGLARELQALGFESVGDLTVWLKGKIP